MAQSQNSFAWKLLERTAQESGQKSLVVSPLSAVYALGMAANGADGATLQEIVGTLGFTGGIDQLNGYCRTMLKQCPSIDRTTTVSIANCVEVNKQYSLKSDFEDAVKDNFDARVESRDFADASLVGDINKWCSRNTGGMISKMFDEIDPEMSAIILNALYFRGLWRSAFSESATRTDKFNMADGQSAEVKMMYQCDDFGYYSDGLMQILSMDYGNGSYSMQIVLPAEGKTTADVLSALQQRKWSDVIAECSKREVEVHLPRFTIETRQSLADALKALGMPTMFTEDADFSRLSDTPMFVSEVIQKAKIEVDESGTKAAAVTEIGFVADAYDPNTPPVFYANRPFIYAITEHSTSTLLFVGQFVGK